GKSRRLPTAGGASTGACLPTPTRRDPLRAVVRGRGAGAPVAGAGAEVLAEPGGEGARGGEAEQAGDLGERVPLVGQVVGGETKTGGLHDRREALPLGDQAP